MIFLARNRLLGLFASSLLLLLASRSASAQDYLIENFNVSNGLPSNGIQMISCDRNGLMWFATDEGLCRYDGHEFKSVEFQGIDKNECEVRSIHEDSEGFLWIIAGNRLYKADTEKGTAEPVILTDTDSHTELTISKRTRIRTTPDGEIWITLSNGYPLCINPHDNSMFQVKVKPKSWTHDNAGMIYYLTDNHEVYVSRDNFATSEYLLSLEQFGDINSIAYAGGSLFLIAPGIIFALNLSTRQYSRFPWNNLNTISQFSDGRICASTNNGVYILDRDLHELYHFSTYNSGPTKLVDNIIRMVCEDKHGGIWVASMYEGVSHIVRNDMGIKQIRDTEDGSRLERITSIDEDRNGNLWCGTETGGLVKYSIADDVLSSVILPFRTPNIASLFQDGDELYVSPFSKSDRIIKLNTLNGSISQLGEVSGIAYSFKRDSDSTLYVGTNLNMFRLDENSNTFELVPGIDKGVFGITGCPDGGMWLHGLNEGLYKFTNGEFREYSAEKGTLPTNSIRDIFCDSNGNVWTNGNGHCLNRYDSNSDRFAHFPISCDKEVSNLYKIIEDGNGMLWATSSKGLIYINPKNGNAIQYSFTELFPYDNFSLTAFFIASDGKAYAGTNSGLLSFEPDNFLKGISPPQITISSFEPLGNFDRDAAIQTTEEIDRESKIILPNKANSFLIRVTDTDYSLPKPYVLEYRIDHISNKWEQIKDGMLSFSSVPSGKHLLELRARGIEGPYQTGGRTIQIYILPPFILSPAGIILMLFTILATAFLLAWIVRSRERKKAEAKAKIDIELQKAENERKEYSSKIEFLSSVAHDIRTPLSLIQMPIEELTQKMVHSSDESIREDLDILNRNSEILRVLINELLDFQKLENKMYTPKIAEYDIVNLAKTAIDRFSLSAGKKSLAISSELPDGHVYIHTDSVMVDKILGNMLSNALKFSESFIKISMHVSDGAVITSIENDGELIPLSARQLIFKPFVRDEHGQVRTSGTGLGLSICRTFSILLGGSLEMDDDLSVNRFILRLPVSELDGKDTANAGEGDADTIMEAARHTASVLIVEDNEDMLNLISRILNKHYNVICACDGEEAMALIERGPLPSIVISDIMMPKSDGFALCKAIKAGEKTSHIPVILLTARIGEESRLQGLEYGADAYFEKPLSAALLLSTVKSLLYNRQIIRNFYSSHPTVDTVELDVNSPDNKFLLSVQEYVMENLANANLSVEDIASHLCVSPSSLLKKLKAISGVTPIEYLLSMRILTAKNMLADSSIPISEISDATGFNSHSYFSKIFKKSTGMTPLQYRESIKK